ncbi:MAG: spondin domain-containing protein [Gammaproteobacteria bacterium]|nr:spondin domain-containing protein [Gammaproteobacteria bacterium]
MKRISAAILATSLFSSGAFAAQYEVTITNLTRGQTFTPILVASHRPGVSLFELGESASSELSALAEGGDISALSTALHATGRLIGTGDSGGLLGPGESTVVSVDAGRHGRAEISLAAMLIPTNDAFISLNAVAAPASHQEFTYFAPVYDAGSEPNDESCSNIPGPVCGGAGGSPEEGGEGFVHIHAGIHGVGDLDPAIYDWRNPAARITIRRVRD